MNRKQLFTAGAVALSLVLITAGSVFSQPPAGAAGGRGGAAAGAQPGGGRGGAGAPGGGAGRGAAPAPTPPPPVSGPIVSIANGKVQGYLRTNVVNYMGIPYAAPPLGDLRWKAPQAAAKWTDVRTSTAPGATCQAAEDCLFINVHTPEGFKAGDKLPVMMWIYGGAYTGGAGNAGFGVSHDGGNFARKGVVVVTFNYRLGRAGWFAHPALDKEPGLHDNYGLMDQIAALKWIQANITQFGGNPKNVTVFGESAGAISTLELMVTPEARGLFHKAIAESGFPRLEPVPLAAAQAYGTRAQTANNITGTDAQVVAALRRLPLSAFPATAGSDPARPLPIADGRLVLPMSIVKAFEQNKEAHIPLIIGGNSADLFQADTSAAAYDALNDRKAELVGVYDPQRTGNKSRIMSDYLTDKSMSEPNRAAARAHVKNGAPTYVYYFSYLTPAARTTAFGAAHLAEVQYVFGNVGPGRGGEVDFQGVSTGQEINAYWAAFAKYGNPGAAAGPTWAKWDDKDEATLEFSSTGPKTLTHNQKARLDFTLAGQPK